jgi:hypothetical protein
MDIVFILAAIVQAIGISLGVGSSTLAISNFFVAIADGKISPDERKMMGIVYVVLRIAMVVILITTAILTTFGYYSFSSTNVAPYGIAFFVLIGVLYINAILMTKRIMPSTLGPSLQASTWYTMGVLNALLPLGLVSFSLTHFLLGYTAVIVLATAVVNGLMAYLKERNTNANTTPEAAQNPK